MTFSWHHNSNQESNTTHAHFSNSSPVLTLHYFPEIPNPDSLLPRNGTRRTTRLHGLDPQSTYKLNLEWSQYHPHIPLSLPGLPILHHPGFLTWFFLLTWFGSPHIFEMEWLIHTLKRFLFPAILEYGWKLESCANINICVLVNLIVEYFFFLYFF